MGSVRPSLDLPMPPTDQSFFQQRSLGALRARIVGTLREAEAVYPPASAIRDRLWTGAIDQLDRVLRRVYHVYEYSHDPECVFRVALESVGRRVVLPDGTLIESGEAVGCLHFWNEHLPRFPPAGPDLGWAKVMRSRVQRSLETLCAHVSTDPVWRDVKALHADAPLPLRPRARQQLRRLAQHHGFAVERIDDDPRRGLEPMSTLQSVGENILLWGFARAYNPAALIRQRFRHGREPLWLSRTALLARYGSGVARGDPDQTATHH